MDKKGLAEALKILKWSQAELSRRTGLSQNAISRQMKGTVRISPVLVAYLNAMLLVRRLFDDASLVVPRDRRRRR